MGRLGSGTHRSHKSITGRLSPLNSMRASYWLGGTGYMVQTHLDTLTMTILHEKVLFGIEL